MAIPSYHDIIDLLQHGHTNQAKEKILELREAALGLQEENLALKQELKEFEHGFNLPPKMVYDKGLYWLRASDEDDESREGPFCQACYDKDKKIVRLHRITAPGGGWFCAVCRNQF